MIPAATGPDARAALVACAALARDHYENFPVRSRLLPREARDDLAAIYEIGRASCRERV